MKTVSGLTEICRMPDGYGRFIQLTAFRGDLIVAMEHGVFLLRRNWRGRYRIKRITPIARRWWEFWK